MKIRQPPSLPLLITLCSIVSILNPSLQTTLLVFANDVQTQTVDSTPLPPQIDEDEITSGEEVVDEEVAEEDAVEEVGETAEIETEEQPFEGENIANNILNNILNVFHIYHPINININIKYKLTPPSPSTPPQILPLSIPPPSLA